MTEALAPPPYVPAHRPPRRWRVAVSGSQTWPVKWRTRIWDDLDEQLARMAPGDTFILRHGNARRGADRAAHLWFMERHGGPHGVLMVEECVDADWDNCIVGQPYRDARGVSWKPCPETEGGKPHRRPSKHSNAPDGCICRWAGQRRNPDVVAHPDHPVDLLLAYCLDRSNGTLKTIECADRYAVNSRVAKIYSRSWRPAAPPAPRNDRDPGGGDS